MRIDAGSLDRRIELWRSTATDDGTATVPGQPMKVATLSAAKRDVSDGERARAGEMAQEVTTRFTVRSNAVTRMISGTDTIRYRGRDYAITGTKEVGDRDDAIEISCSARPDQAIGS